MSESGTAASGEPAVGTMISEFSGPGVPRILDRIGFAFGIVDAEHGAFGYSDMATMAAVTARMPFELLVRVTTNSREHIGRALDLGADGIVVPMVEDADDARRAVRAAKYAPLGERGVSVTRAHSGYGVRDLPSYLAAANDRTKLYVQIESPGAVAAASQIASVPGVRGLLVGPNDFLQSTGAPGQLEHPELDRAMVQVADAARGVGVESGVISSSAALLRRGAELGMAILSYDSELGHLIKGATSALTGLNESLRPARAPSTRG